jgi:tripartite-type tricarboxylate transporter receptor subunit TctC
MRRREFLSLLGGAVAGWPHGAAAQPAQNWPQRVVRIVVPFVPGGGTDAIARILAAGLTKSAGYQIVIENKGGGSTNIGTEAVAHAAPDGYTLLMGTNATQTMNEFLYPSTGYDAAKDFAPVVLVGMLPMVVAANLDFVPGTIPALVAAAKAQPDKINVALPSTSARVVFEFLKERTGAPLFGVPYKGSGTAMTEVMGGQVQLIVDTATALRGHVQNGKLKAIAITTLKSGDLLPGVKSVAEQGIAGFEMTPWTAMYAPRGTPKEIVDKLNAEVMKVLAEPEARQKLLQLGFEAAGGTPDQLGAFEKSERAKWGSLIKAAGLKGD